MNSKFALVAASLFALVTAPAAIAGSQQEKMKTCNAEAKTKALKGDERKAFMKECLSTKGENAKGAPKAQQEKMKSCNAEAKTKALKGDERKQFMSNCLSN
ncbi:MAG: phosphate starvation-inducible protein PsiF [Gammaproteobacteria bacterium]|nr:phosphate starvation-inducible protein PsiF [Gammaproteobacteria bacterium]MBU1416272.1 phosphate starvation-inducible protein PsiF [Gammaproteobacteria bacterium]